jgi:glycosyltransferase involved in cell wall biosynthesis
MRVLYLVEATIAGVRTHVQTLALGMHKRGFDVSVACPPRRQRAYGEHDFVDELRQAGVAVIPLPLQREVAPAADTYALRKTLDLLKSGRFDLLHTHSSKAGFVGRVAGKLAGVPVVHTPHSLHFLGQRSWPKRQFYLRVEQALGPLAERLIAVSASEQALMLHHRLARPERVVCIPNGVDLDNLAPLARDLLHVPEGVPLIGTLARLEEQKNPWLFVRAAALLHRALPDAHFLWCGDGALRGEVERLAQRLGLGAHLHITGYRRDARALLAACDLFWLTSRFEGLPQALIEAMMLGRPSVATDVVGNRDLISHGKTGLLVPDDDAKALTRATLALLSRPDDAAALSAAGQALAYHHYTARQMLAATTLLYHTVVPPLYGQEPVNREVSLEHQPRYVGDA